MELEDTKDDVADRPKLDTPVALDSSADGQCGFATVCSVSIAHGEVISCVAQVLEGRSIFSLARPYEELGFFSLVFISIYRQPIVGSR
jgi:hypothetical protein